MGNCLHFIGQVNAITIDIGVLSTLYESTDTLGLARKWVFRAVVDVHVRVLPMAVDSFAVDGLIFRVRGPRICGPLEFRAKCPEIGVDESPERVIRRKMVTTSLGSRRCAGARNTDEHFHKPSAVRLLV